MGAESFHTALRSLKQLVLQLSVVELHLCLDEDIDMAVLRLAMLLQGLLLAARCEVRARDPEVEEEDLKDMSDGAGWTHDVPLAGFGAPHNVDGLNTSPDVYGAIHHPLHHKHPSHGQHSLDVPVTPTAEAASHGSLQRTG